MLQKIILTTLLFTSFLGLSQTATIYSGTYESPFTDWSILGPQSPNKWVNSDCAGNGIAFSGTNSLYVSNLSAGSGCTSSYSYDDAPSGTLYTLAYTPVDATCASSLTIQYDYTTGGLAAEDFTELVYSTDGVIWNVLGSALTINASWSTVTASLPPALDFSSFFIGFRFTYNDATVAGQPTAIDNVVISGTDTQKPLMTCPTTVDLPVDGTCSAIADDFAKSLVALSDNCTDSVNILVNQNIPFGTNIGVAPGGSVSITLTATDESGNSESCSFTLNIIDDTDPQIITCPGDTNLYVNNSCNILLGDYTALAAGTDNCSSVLFSQSPPVGTIISGQGTITPVTITATDDSGNSVQCSFNATSVDTIVPTIICPSNTTVYADAACEFILPDYTNAAVASDNCVASSSLIITQSPIVGTTVTGTQTITLTVSGGIPSTAQSCQFQAVFVDTIKPNVICPIPAQLSLSGSCDVSLTDYSSSVGWTDNCTSSSASMNFSQAPIGGTMISSNTTVTITTTDPSGNSRTCSFMQTVIDDIDPVLSCPGDQTLTLNTSCFATIPDYTTAVSSVENCFYSNPVTYTQSPIAGTTLNGPAVVTIIGTDESGNQGSCAFNINVIDATNPTITCPSDNTVALDAGCSYLLGDVSSLAVYADNCTPQGSLIYSQLPAAGTILTSGIHAIQLTIEDIAGNSNTCTYNLTVEDQTDPQVNCSSNISLPIDINCQAVLTDYTTMGSIVDNCSSLSQLTVTQNPPAGTLINSNTQIIINAVDQAGNSASCSFFALIIDNISPTINCPSNVNATTTSGCDYLIPDLSSQVTYNDNCLVGISVYQNPAIGTPVSGITSVLVTVFDQSGNSASCSSLITPIDTEVPVINCPNPAPVNNGANCTHTLGNYTTTALVVDNCSNYTIVQTPAVGTTLQTGSHVIQLDVIDIGGNIGQCSFVLDINENVPPTITCPNDITGCDPVVNFTDPLFSDNCFAFITQTDASGLISGDEFPIGTTTLSYIVEDSSSNTASCSFTIQVLDFPSVADILVDSVSLCQVTSVVVEALPVTSGTGQWTLLSGQGTFNNPSANLTGVNNLNYGTNELLWTISSASCGSYSDTVAIYVYEAPLAASTLDTVYLCNVNYFNLSANVPLYGTGTWTTDQGATITNTNLATSAAANLTNGWNQFVWTITNGSCPSTSDTMDVFVAPVAQIDQPDTAVCIENGSVQLTATSPIIEQSVLWIFVSGSGNLSDPFSNNTLIDDIGLGLNMVVYQMNTDNCLPTTDTIIIVSSLCDGFTPEFPTVITPNLDGKNDIFVIDYLDQLYPECRVTVFNRWGSVVYESVGYEDPWNGTFKGEELPMGTYFYKIELNDDKATVYNGPISIIR